MALLFQSSVWALMLFFLWINKSKADPFGDIRCICICDKTWNPTGKKVEVKSPAPQEFCNCEQVVKPMYPTLPCSGCFCNVEARNTKTIKAVVLIICCVVSLLLASMMFFALLDPLIQRCLDCYLEPAHSVDELKTAEGDPKASSSPAPAATSTAGKESSKFNNIQTKQKKWNGTGQEQRRHIHGKHTVLD